MGNKIHAGATALAALAVFSLALGADFNCTQSSEARPSLVDLQAQIDDLVSGNQAQQTEIETLQARGTLHVVDANGAIVGLATGGSIDRVYLESVERTAFVDHLTGELPGQFGGPLFADPLCEGQAFQSTNDAYNILVKTVNGVKRVWIPRRESVSSEVPVANLDDDGCDFRGPGFTGEFVRADEVPIAALGLSLPYTPPFYYAVLSE